MFVLILRVPDAVFKSIGRTERCYTAKLWVLVRSPLIDCLQLPFVDASF